MSLEIKQLNINEDNKACTLKLSGRIDSLTSPELEEKFKEVWKSYTNITVDFEEVDYISSACLRIL